ncbi:MAG: hypothetical protein U5K73_11110 [Halofilum sp. (in: g-proteobacteria)]|nr:hypothetical protein [Halofilum sp. (in: g-proteobacteria)]
MDDGGQSFDQLTDHRQRGCRHRMAYRWLGGANGNDLVVDLATTATTGQINTIVEALRYNSSSDTFDGTRDITITLSDGNNDNGSGNDAGGPSALTDTLSASTDDQRAEMIRPRAADATLSPRTRTSTLHAARQSDFGFSQPGGETGRAGRCAHRHAAGQRRARTQWQRT